MNLIKQLQLISETGSYPSDDAYETALQTIAEWLVKSAVRDLGDGGRDVDMVLDDYLGDTIASLQEYIQQAREDV